MDLDCDDNSPYRGETVRDNNIAEKNVKIASKKLAMLLTDPIIIFVNNKKNLIV